MKENSTKPKLEIKKADFILIGAILIISIIAAGFATQTGSYSGEAKVRITVAGEEYGIYPLNEERDIVVNKMYKNTISISKDSSGKMYVHMKASNCPGQDCVHHAQINLQRQNIICLPNKLIVEIVGGEVAIDAYTY